MTDHLQNLMQELGEAVHQSLDDSSRIAGVLKDFRQAGYAVVLSVDATLSSTEQDPEEEANAEVAVQSEGGNGSLSLTEQDQVFLRALNITP